MHPIEFYEEGEVKGSDGPGDYVRMRFGDGDTAETMVSGLMLTSGEETEVHVFGTSGRRFRLREGDDVEIITGSPRRSRAGFL